MPIFIVNHKLVVDELAPLSPEDQKHLIKSLRAKSGQTVFVTDNQGHLAQCTLKNTKPVELIVSEVSKQKEPHPITVGLPLIEQSRMEWAIEKLTELGVQTVQLILTERTQGKTISDNKFKRLQKMAVEAQKQCFRTYPLQILPPKPWKDITTDYSNIYFGDLNPSSQKTTQNQKVLLLIGPEGGWSDSETQALTKLAKPLNYPSYILRAETAAVVLSSLLIY